MDKDQIEEKITTDWKYKYGKKFKECIVEIEVNLKGPVNKKEILTRNVVDTKTGDIYPSISEAAKETGRPHHFVYCHCKRVYGIGFDYKFKYA